MWQSSGVKYSGGKKNLVCSNSIYTIFYYKMVDLADSALLPRMQFPWTVGMSAAFVRP